MDDLFFRNVFLRPSMEAVRRLLLIYFLFLTFLFLLQTNRSVIPERRNIHASAVRLVGSPVFGAFVSWVVVDEDVSDVFVSDMNVSVSVDVVSVIFVSVSVSEDCVSGSSVSGGSVSVSCVSVSVGIGSVSLTGRSYMNTDWISIVSLTSKMTSSVFS